MIIIRFLANTMTLALLGIGTHTSIEGWRGAEPRYAFINAHWNSRLVTFKLHDMLEITYAGSEIEFLLRHALPPMRACSVLRIRGFDDFSKPLPKQGHRLNGSNEVDPASAKRVQRLAQWVNTISVGCDFFDIPTLKASAWVRFDPPARSAPLFDLMVNQLI